MLSDLSATSVRHGFVRKVYGILIFQLAVTIGIGAWVMRLGEAWILDHPNSVTLALAASSALTIASLCALSCNPQLMRKTPQNYILLSLFTLGKAVLIGFISAQYAQESVLIAMGIVALTVFGLTIFTCQTTYDFTGVVPYVFTCGLVLCGLGLALSLASMLGAGAFEAFGVLRLLYAAGGALLFSFYIVLDTQRIVGGKTELDYSVDDYAMAAISLYLDILNLFAFLLQVFGKRNK